MIVSMTCLFISLLHLGVTFINRPININERIHLKIFDVDERRQWCGSLAIGMCQSLSLTFVPVDRMRICMYVTRTH
jgi:hypothetical protein